MSNGAHIATPAGKTRELRRSTGAAEGRRWEGHLPGSLERRNAAVAPAQRAGALGSPLPRGPARTPRSPATASPSLGEGDTRARGGRALTGAFTPGVRADRVFQTSREFSRLALSLRSLSSFGQTSAGEARLSPANTFVGTCPPRSDTSNVFGRCPVQEPRQEPPPPRAERTGGREGLGTLRGLWVRATGTAALAGTGTPAPHTGGGLPARPPQGGSAWPPRLAPPYLVQNQVMLPVTQRGAVRPHQLHEGHGENPLTFVLGWERQMQGEVKPAGGSLGTRGQGMGSAGRGSRPPASPSGPRRGLLGTSRFFPWSRAPMP